MGGYYDEIEIEDMVFDPVKKVFHYPCPCGDRFEISKGQLRDYEDIATCPSCSLIIRVIYDPLDYEDYEDEDEDDDGVEEEVDEESDDEDEEGVGARKTEMDKFQDALDKLTINEKTGAQTAAEGKVDEQTVVRDMVVKGEEFGINVGKQPVAVVSS